MYPSSFSTLAIASFSFEAGTMISDLPELWPLRMRVRKSAIGSVMLIGFVAPGFQPLPAGLAEARNFAAHRRLAQLVASEAELAVVAARPSGDLATVAQADLARIARQGLQLRL